jgi:hypothetical protein
MVTQAAALPQGHFPRSWFPYPPYAMIGFSTGVHGVVGENGWAVFATFTADRYTEFAKITIREKRVPWCYSCNSAVTW